MLNKIPIFSCYHFLYLLKSNDIILRWNKFQKHKAGEAGNKSNQSESAEKMKIYSINLSEMIINHYSKQRSNYE